MSAGIVESLLDYYSNFGSADLSKLSELYANEIHFKDPIVDLYGIEALKNYFSRSREGLISCTFEFQDCVMEDHRATLVWTMTYAHKNLKGKKELSLEGSSYVVCADDKIIFHRDFYDLGQMLYEHIPLVGSAVRYIKGRL